MSEWSRIKAAVAQDGGEAARRARETMLAANATPETVRRLRVCVVTRLARRGKLSAEQVQAAEEIERVWTLVTRELFTRVADYRATLRGRSPDQSWSPSADRAYRDRYCPWREDEASRVILRHGVTVADLVFEIVCDNMGPRQVADRHGMDQRRVEALLQASLYRYAEMAGWVGNARGEIRSAAFA